MKAQVFKTNGDIIDIEVNSFTDLQRAVGGDVTVTGQFSGGAILANEDGLALGLPVNPHSGGLVVIVVKGGMGWLYLPYYGACGGGVW